MYQKESEDSEVACDVKRLERLKQCDEHAYIALYDLHSCAVFRFLLHMTGSIHTAEELTQEVFVIVLEFMCRGKLGQFDPEKGTLEAYLIGIARNLARAERRRAYRLVSLDSVFENPRWHVVLNDMWREGAGLDPAELVASRSALKLLYCAIRELPDRYRETLVLCSLQEKSYQDAATILRCSEGTVASRINRAKALLAAKIRQLPPENGEIDQAIEQ